MSNLSKVLKYSLYLLIFLMVGNVLSTYIRGADEKLPIGLWYVYSESMEPVLMIDDGFILIKTKDYKVDDVITFKPKISKHTYVTHRIIGIVEENQFITKGDSNPISDQQGGEPNISKEQIMGKAVTINKGLIVLPGLGLVLKKLNTGIKRLNPFILVAMTIILFLFKNVINKLLYNPKRPLPSPKHID